MVTKLHSIDGSLSCKGDYLFVDNTCCALLQNKQQCQQKISHQKYNVLTAYVTQRPEQRSQRLSYGRETRVQAMTQQEIQRRLYVGGGNALSISETQTTIMITQWHSKILSLVQGVSPHNTNSIKNSLYSDIFNGKSYDAATNTLADYMWNSLVTNKTSYSWHCLKNQIPTVSGYLPKQHTERIVSSKNQNALNNK